MSNNNMSYTYIFGEFQEGSKEIKAIYKHE